MQIFHVLFINILSMFDRQGFVLLVQSDFHTQMNFRLQKIVFVLLYNIHKMVIIYNSFYYVPAYSMLVYDGVLFSIV